MNKEEKERTLQNFRDARRRLHNEIEAIQNKIEGLNMAIDIVESEKEEVKHQ